MERINEKILTNLHIIIVCEINTLWMNEFIIIIIFKKKTANKNIF